VVTRDNIVGFICSRVRGFDGLAEICSNVPTPSVPSAARQLVASKLNSACVDTQGLKISVAFRAPVTGQASIQVFSTGPDFFPSGQGMTDTYEMSRMISTEVDRLEFIIPVASMPVGEKLFGNIIVSDGEGIFSHVAYLINVYDCSATDTPLPDSASVTRGDPPVIHSATCLPDRQLMLAFKFDEPVLGQYQALVEDLPFQLASVVSQPALLFFSGAALTDEPIVIKLVSATDQVIVFEETYTPPDCSAN
jgi:hypothetical protein